MPTSKVRHCGTQCLESGIVARGEQSRASKENARPIENIKLSVTTPRTPSDKLAAYNAQLGHWPKRKETASEPVSVIKKINNEKMKGENNMQTETVNASVKTPVEVITPKEPRDLQKSMRQGTAETQPESLGEPLKNIVMESSGILNLSKRSAERLMRLMESTVSDHDLDRQQDGGPAPDLYRVETAIKCANAIASIVQVNVNLLKAIKGTEK